VVTVSGFEVTVPKRSRSGRNHYTVRLVSDPASDSWQPHNAYRGGTLGALMHEIVRAMNAAGVQARINAPV
jgi:hypothetical protein